jgi:hypothetical protein
MIWLAPALSSSAISGVVAVITGTRPIFTLIYSTIPSLDRLKIFEESPDSSSLTIKLVSVARIIRGNRVSESVG